MGIPKFFRYISERYPLTSQLITENKIPEFDNLYLDFNGIIHNCSHPNDEDAHFRLSEEQIFTSIFSYVDMLFSKVKPKKLFFMAVDGVAPRAKMNQQRSRRFRTAKEAKEVREKAERKGEKLPDEKAFDSNCITPGTVFMARLSDQLRYFINKKITEDSDWRDVEVVLSGHEVPGEGEHKIMEYIRLSRAQQDYNPNVRHCLYGLDADLIMLGLLSHDPHFCLLREEVKFGPAARKKGSGSLESINFYLLHLSLLREYLNLEFQDIAEVIPFQYDLERVIDDFVLLAVFVGNDFLPNLPDLHIHDNGLERLFDVYKKVLPSLDGYLNEGGVINTRRLQVVLDEMALWEEEIFQKEYSDLNWIKGKQSKHVKAMEQSRQRSQLVLTQQQREIFDQVKALVSASSPPLSSLAMPNTFSARDRSFITTLASRLNLTLAWDEYDENDQNLVTLRLPEPEPVDAVGQAEESVDGEVSDGSEESRAAISRVLKQYENASVIEQDSDPDAQGDRVLQQKMGEWKDFYYQGKLGFPFKDEQELNKLVFKYAEGLQWVMHYYYSGVASWSWFYNYHYAPRISDLRGLEDMEFTFELGTPFKPFQQLMGVLPEASKELIPVAYQDLMNDSNSPILDFYPTEFEQDLNGKKQDWEAVVKIPFIDESRLIRAMTPRDQRLTPEELRRNSFGTSNKFSYDPEDTRVYPSSLPGFFPALAQCACKTEPFYLPTLDGLHLVEGLCSGVVLGAEALAGFPSLNTLRHAAQIGFHGVNVHGSESRNKSVVVHVENDDLEDAKSEKIAEERIGKRTFVGWPFLQEGMVVAVSDGLFRYEKGVIVPGSAERVLANPHSPQGMNHWKMKAERIEQTYSKRFGVITGPVHVLFHVRPLKGLNRVESGAFIKQYEVADKEMEVAAQMAISDVVSEDPRYVERDAPPLNEEFEEGSKIFFLGEHAYGAAAKVSATTETSLSVILAFDPSDKSENDKFKEIINRRGAGAYIPSFKVAEMVGISGRGLSRITSSFLVVASDNIKINLGLNLKFEAKALKVIDYSRKDRQYWEFSEKAVELIREYKTKFPTIFDRVEHGGDEMVKASDALGPDTDAQLKEVKAWLKAKGIRDLVPVSLFCDQLPKNKVTEIETLANQLYTGKSSGPFKKAVVKGIPRRAVLKPSDAVYRLQNQRFSLGDRVTMVRDSGGVPLSVKGVVVGLNAKTIDVVWDVPFMSGGTLGDRCSQYRGSSVEFNACLNLSDPQFVASTKPNAPAQQQAPSSPFRPRLGPRPVIQPPPGQLPASGFRPARANQSAPVHIMTNPNRTRPAFANGAVNFQSATASAESSPAGSRPGPERNREGYHGNRGATHTRGAGRGGFQPSSSRGGFVSGSERGRGGFRGGHRGRGRGVAQPLAS